MLQPPLPRLPISIPMTPMRQTPVTIGGSSDGTWDPGGTLEARRHSDDPRGEQKRTTHDQNRAGRRPSPFHASASC
eukprot:1357613-Pyramimonas_sp.AAC.1